MVVFLVLTTTIMLLHSKRNLSFPVLFKLGKRGNSRIPREFLNAYFVVVSMRAKRGITAVEFWRKPS